jgi:hypothetical protein
VAQYSRAWQLDAERWWMSSRHAFQNLQGRYIFLSPLRDRPVGHKVRMGNPLHPTYLEESPHMFLRLLAALPFIGILLGVPFVNRVEPLVLGMPFVLAWIVLWVVLTSVVMAIIYRLDPANRQIDADSQKARS